MLTSDIAQAVTCLQQGGVIAYPTEAVYGLGCDPSNLPAVARLLQLKQRPADKGLILIAADVAQLVPWILPLAPALQAQILATWPGPVTWVLPTYAHISPLIRGEHDSLAVRVTAHPLCCELCTRLGHAIISTSANPSDQQPARSALQVAHYFPQQLDAILDGPLGAQAQPTEIRDGRTGAIIRPA